MKVSGFSALQSQPGLAPSGSGSGSGKRARCQVQLESGRLAGEAEPVGVRDLGLLLLGLGRFLGVSAPLLLCLDLVRRLAGEGQLFVGSFTPRRFSSALSSAIRILRGSFASDSSDGRLSASCSGVLTFFVPSGVLHLIGE